MRVIAGTAKGRPLKAPRSNHIRPTADRVKEALFSILVSHLGGFHGLKILDLCAGTGNLGIEALSRGAEQAVFVDSSREATQLIEANLALLNFSARSTLLQLPLNSALKHLINAGQGPFDLVFLDPPYALDIPAEVMPALGNSTLLAPSAVVVVEQDAKQTLAESYGRLTLFDHRLYGDTALFFYLHAGKDSEQTTS